RSADAELTDQGARALARAVPVQPPAVDPGRYTSHAEHHIVGHIELGDEPFRRAVLGDERHRPVALDPAPERTEDAGNRAEQLALAVPLDGGKSEDLPSLNREIRVAQRQPVAPFSQ